MRVSNVQVSAHAIADAKKLGITGDVPSRLQRMVANAAPVTHSAGNRRFEDYVLRVTTAPGGSVIVEAVSLYMKKTG